MRRKARRTMIADNLFAHCDQSGGPDACWPYLRCRHHQHGYGSVWVDGKLWGAHRLAYTITKGPIPEGLKVLHSCDNPPCCNPAHLRIGTQLDNARDREERGRGNQPAGEDNSQSKLTTRDVIFIRRCRDIFNTEDMARMLGVQRSAVCKVLEGSTWGHVVDLPAGRVA